MARDKAPYRWPTTWLFEDHRETLSPEERLIDIAQDIRLLVFAILIFVII